MRLGPAGALLAVAAAILALLLHGMRQAPVDRVPAGDPRVSRLSGEAPAHTRRETHLHARSSTHAPQTSRTAWKARAVPSSTAREDLGGGEPAGSRAAGAGDAGEEFGFER